ncbi:MAG TPA: SpoIIE family protein phosphatase [Clostridia bacterium]|nr:SpoIIE family protein phosphatase [Clostridia bacterium]HRX42314.1 SpoIIE family protein phosphatase [Clostridia bacterium]
MNIEKLKESKNFMMKLMEVAVSPIFVVDEDMRIQSYNDSFSNLFNKSENEILGKLPGNSFGCAFLNENEECGETENCVKCILRHQMLEAMRSGKPTQKSIIEKAFRIDDQIIKKQLSVEIKPMVFGDEKYFIGIFNDVSDVVELKEQVYNQFEKMKRDLLVARALQNGLLPREKKLGPLEISYEYKPCETLGGDFLDFYRIDKNHVGFIIADVAGHGITSSMFTMFLYSMIDRSETSPARLLRSAFDEFSKFNVVPESYITMLAAIINLRNKSVTFSNAGFTNPPAVVYGDEIEKIEIEGIPISNWVKDPTYKEITVRFRQGDRMIFFSDGISEMRSSNRSFVGGDYMYSVLSDKNRHAGEIITDLFRKSNLEDRYYVKDDITVAVIDFK